MSQRSPSAQFLDSTDASAPAETQAAADLVQTPAQALARGVCRALEAFGYATLTEFTLRSGRRVDVIGIEPAGTIAIVEVKTSVEDFRSDRKWQEYLEFSDHFFFAVPAGFPHAILPADCGLMAADAYGAAILRDSPRLRLNAARRRAQTLRFAVVAAQRLSRLVDPRVVDTRGVQSG